LNIHNLRNQFLSEQQLRLLFDRRGRCDEGEDVTKGKM
jgi:hypothetical protein